MSTPTRFPDGVTTAGPQQLFSDYQWHQPFDQYEYRNDFSTYAAGDWTVTSTNSGTSALADGEGGWLVQTTGATTTNYQANQLTNLSFYMVTGYRHWFQISFKVGDTAHTALQMGWVDTLAGPLTAGSGIYFEKADTSTTLNLILNNAGTKTTVGVSTIAASTWYSVGWYYDGKSNPTLYVFSSAGLALPYNVQGRQVYGGALVKTIGANSSSNTSLANLPAATVGHTLGFGLSTGTNTAHTLTVDHIMGCSAVNRF